MTFFILSLILGIAGEIICWIQCFLYTVANSISSGILTLYIMCYFRSYFFFSDISNDISPEMSRNLIVSETSIPVYINFLHWDLKVLMVYKVTIKQ